MYKTSKLESGKTYSLSQIFSPDFAIAIPDLQRDYCWGLETYDNKGNNKGELVSKFLGSLREKWAENLASEAYTPMGLIYGYEWPKGTYQLCDGQQRITTFYLLAGELYRNTLVSDGVKKDLYNILAKSSNGGDDSTIASGLQYSIRETTLYFLSDLVNHYFLRSDCDLEFYNLSDRARNHLILKPNIRPAWYFMEYDLDPTIQSMLGAIYTIRKFLNESFKDASEITSFAKAVINQFSFIYYDMGNRVHGEETFVVLNTSGEPLTATENLKPLLIAQLRIDEHSAEQISNQWEEREDWFWKHRSDKELTSDNLSRDFYAWWLLINGNTDTIDLLKDFTSRQNLTEDIVNIHKLYISLLDTIHWIESTESAKRIFTKLYGWKESQIDLSTDKTILDWIRATRNREIALPLLYFHQKFGETELLQMLRRLAKNYYYENENVHVKFRDIVNIIKQASTAKEVLEDSKWYDDDERNKETVFFNNTEELVDIETDDNLRFDLNVLWKAEVQSIEDARHVQIRLGELHSLAQGKSVPGYDEQIAISMSNHYRLLKFLKGWCWPNGKQNYVNWKYWGTWFSDDTHSNNRERAYNDSEFCKLLQCNDLTTILRDFTRETVKHNCSLDDICSEQSISAPYGLMRVWLISKFLVNEYAKKDKSLISAYNDYSLCVNQVNKFDNLLNKDMPVSIGNLCLCFANKNGTWRVGKNYYNNFENLDTPLYIGLNIGLEDVSYDNFLNREVSVNVINQTSNYIKSLFETYITPKEKFIQ